MRVVASTQLTLELQPHVRQRFATLHWLMAEFLQDADTKRRSAVDQISTLMPQIAALLVDAGASPKAGRR